MRRPRLVDDPLRALRGYSFICSVAGTFLLLSDLLLYQFRIFELDPYWVGRLALLLWIASMALRLVKQDRSHRVEFTRGVIVVLLLALLALASVPRAFGETVPEQLVINTTIPLTGQEEGLRLHAYKPFVWDKWTICYGETNGVGPGMVATPEQCRVMLYDSLAGKWRGLRQYFTPGTLQDHLPATRAAGYLDTAYNCGYGAIGNSTATRRLNAGDVVGGCEALTWWNRGGGRVLVGLVRRRQRDYDYCMVGVK